MALVLSVYLSGSLPLRTSKASALLGQRLLCCHGKHRRGAIGCGERCLQRHPPSSTRAGEEGSVWSHTARIPTRRYISPQLQILKRRRLKERDSKQKATGRAKGSKEQRRRFVRKREGCRMLKAARCLVDPCLCSDSGHDAKREKTQQKR